jgi:hypothetical protein
MDSILSFLSNGANLSAVHALGNDVSESQIPPPVFQMALSDFFLIGSIK